MRPSWDMTWKSIAETIAHRSRCDMRKVGAVIVSHDNAYSCVGYNGPPSSLDVEPGSTCRSWCPRGLKEDQTRDYRNCVSAHAEANAIARADWSRIQGATIYVSSTVCWDCAKIIANTGIVRVCMFVDWERDAHRDPQATIDFLRECDIAVVVNGV